VPRPWSILDFLVVWVAGYLGTGIFYAAATLAGSDCSLVIGIAGQYVGSLGALWLLSRRRRDSPLGLVVQGSDAAYIGLGLLLQIVLALLFLPLTRALFPEGEAPQVVTDLISDPNASTVLKLSLFATAVLIAPLTEELVFRGVLIEALEPRGRRFAVVVSALIFSAVHILGLETSTLLAGAAVVLPPLFLVGLALATVTVRTGRLGPAIFMHSGYNLLAALVLLIPDSLPNLT
jgi:membrane protease YdiL (CAAX protease family)